MSRVKYRKDGSDIASPTAAGETIMGKSDCKITGVDSTMEYKAEGSGEYASVTGAEIAAILHRFTD